MSGLNRYNESAYENSHYNRFFNSRKNAHMVKVLPGGLYCTGDAEIIATGLGSCISACIWDPELEIGGMNHFLLPFDSQDQMRHWHPDEVISTASRYGSYAMEMLINTLLSKGASRDRLLVKVFGGAQMMGRFSMIGKKNIEFILNYIEQESLHVVAQDLGGMEPRKILFDPQSGRAWLKRIPFTEIHHLQQEEEKYASNLDKESHRPHDDDVELF